MEEAGARATRGQATWLCGAEALAASIRETPGSGALRAAEGLSLLGEVKARGISPAGSEQDCTFWGEGRGDSQDLSITIFTNIQKQ